MALKPNGNLYWRMSQWLRRVTYFVCLDLPGRTLTINSKTSVCGQALPYFVTIYFSKPFLAPLTVCFSPTARRRDSGD